MAAQFDRSNVSKIYKGAKCGSLAEQNISSVLRLSEEENLKPRSFAIPLDFSRFSCVCDLMLIEADNTGSTTTFIEVKEGKVNLAFSEAREANHQDKYLHFIEQYGEKGIKQAERCFRQETVMSEKTETYGALPGVYEQSGRVTYLIQPKTQYQHFATELESLVKKARNGEYAAQIIDKCLVIAVVDTSSAQRATLAEFDARVLVYNAYINPDGTAGIDTSTFVSELERIKLTDWLEGYGSIYLEPLPLRPVRSRTLLDLSFGRIRLQLYLHIPLFVDMCRSQGVKAGFISKRKTNKLKGAGQLNGYPLVEGRAVGYILGSLPLIMGSAKLHEIMFNWVRPMSILQELREIDGTIREMDGQPSSNPAFTPDDLEY